MRRNAASLLTTLAAVLALWFILSRLRIVVLVNIPWWGLLVLGFALFLAIDYVLQRVLGRN
ncbi:MAG TPA: hypothetical protein VFT99_10330 [Roseiflexaceae bacterium]|jgi:hypothetical protein|nr:hypothetical protein [Roseiflexaceae bacterium]